LVPEGTKLFGPTIFVIKYLSPEIKMDEPTQILFAYLLSCLLISVVGPLVQLVGWLVAKDVVGWLIGWLNK
jgi:hypothetical protein